MMSRRGRTNGPDGSLNEIGYRADTTRMGRPSILRRIRQRAHSRSDRAATIVEAAIVTPVVMLILLSVLEFGMLFRNYLTVTQMTRDAARTASAYGDDYDADFRIASIAANTAKVATSGEVKRMVVFRGTNEELSVVPDVCKTVRHDDPLVNSDLTDILSGPENCIILTPDTWADAERYGCNNFGNTAGDDPDFDLNWCPTLRDVAATGGTDYVGVWVEFEHKWVTGLFGDSMTITESMIMRLEPKEF
ncbi:MAG: TadE/TadG family type IV pilus assembly protein [Acidimicrobiales bacterium]